MKPTYDELLSLCEEMRDSLYEAIEHTSSHLEDMEHYFNNKCIPTVDEVNQCAIADSRLRIVYGKANEMLAKGEK